MVPTAAPPRGRSVYSHSPVSWPPLRPHHPGQPTRAHRPLVSSPAVAHGLHSNMVHWRPRGDGSHCGPIPPNRPPVATAAPSPRQRLPWPTALLDVMVPTAAPSPPQPGHRSHHCTRICSNMASHGQLHSYVSWSPLRPLPPRPTSQDTPRQSVPTSLFTLPCVMVPTAAPSMCPFSTIHLIGTISGAFFQ